MNYTKEKCKVCGEIKETCDYTWKICKKCYKKANDKLEDLDHWDLWELTKDK